MEKSMVVDSLLLLKVPKKLLIGAVSLADKNSHSSYLHNQNIKICKLNQVE